MMEVAGDWEEVASAEQWHLAWHSQALQKTAANR